MKIFLNACLVAALSGFMLTSCDSYKDNETPDQFFESEKDLSGVWQLTTVKRNTIDITPMMDFSNFRLYLNSDGSYKKENSMPFPVRHNGVWTVDDPRHPYCVSFTENESLGSVDVDINYPIVNGERQLSITHSPGCGANTYEYLFVKAK